MARYENQPQVIDAATPRRLPRPEWIGECVGSAGLLFAAVTAIRLVAPGGALAGVSAILDGKTLVVGCAVGGAVVLYGLTPLGQRSGGHVNPAVTLFLWLRRGLGGVDAIAYVFAQVLGSLIGVAAARLIWGRAVIRIQYGLIQPRPGLSALATAAGEFGMTCALLTVIAVSGRLASKRVAAACVFGVIVLMIWFGGPWSGASFNPIRNLSPAVFSADFRLQGTYLAAPLIASLVVAGLLRVRERLQLRTSVHKYQGEGDGYTTSDSVAAAGQ